MFCQCFMSDADRERGWSWLLCGEVGGHRDQLWPIPMCFLSLHLGSGLERAGWLVTTYAGSASWNWSPMGTRFEKPLPFPLLTQKMLNPLLLVSLFEAHLPSRPPPSLLPFCRYRLWSVLILKSVETLTEKVKDHSKGAFT